MTEPASRVRATRRWSAALMRRQCHSQMRIQGDTRCSEGCWMTSLQSESGGQCRFIVDYKPRDLFEDIEFEGTRPICPPTRPDPPVRVSDCPSLCLKAEQSSSFERIKGLEIWPFSYLGQMYQASEVRNVDGRIRESMVLVGCKQAGLSGVGWFASCLYRSGKLLESEQRLPLLLLVAPSSLSLTNLPDSASIPQW